MNMKKHLKNTICIIIMTVATGLTVMAQNSLQEKVEAIAGDQALAEAVMSICVRNGEGNTLVDINAEDMVMPASNMKLISTGAAMHSFGPEHKFETGIGYDGEIKDGVLHGDLYIIGGGDPTTGSKDSIATALAETFAAWKKMITDAGIRRIEGKVFGDGRFFDGMAEHPTWLWNDIGTYYGAGATGLMFYGNMQSFMASAGSSEGAPVNIQPSYPSCPWMEFRYDCVTGKAGTGDQLYMYASDLAPVAEIRGTFAVDRSRKRVDCSNKFPEFTCASYFTDYLRANGISCGEGPADFRLCRPHERAAQDSIKIIGKTFSPELKRIIFETNHASDNLYAETLLRHLGKAATGSACYDSSLVALNGILKQLSVNSKGAKITDGSGLSRQNYVSADFMCRFLEAMMSSPYFEDYIHTIPSPGSNGTLAANMKDCPAEVKSRIKVKSGSMNGVRCYSGYVIPSQGCKDETIIFSIMINNCTSQTWKVRQLRDKIMAALAAAN